MLGLGINQYTVFRQNVRVGFSDWNLRFFFSRYLTESSGTKYETKQNFAKLGEGLAIINQNKVKRTETLYVKVRVHGLGSLQAFFVGLWRSPYNIFTLTFVQYYSVTPWRYIQYSARKKPYCTCTFHLLSNSLKFEECKMGSVFHLSFYSTFYVNIV